MVCVFMWMHAKQAFSCYFLCSMIYIKFFLETASVAHAHQLCRHRRTTGNCIYFFHKHAKNGQEKQHSKNDVYKLEKNRLKNKCEHSFSSVGLLVVYSLCGSA